MCMCEVGESVARAFPHQRGVKVASMELPPRVQKWRPNVHGCVRVGVACRLLLSRVEDDGFGGPHRCGARNLA